MKQRRIGDRTVSALGLGAMPMSVRETNDEDRGLATIAQALDSGVTLIDTADAYCKDETDFGANELLVAKALEARGAGPDEVLVATKGGHTRPDGSWALDGHPDYLRDACLASIQRLGVEQIGLWQHHRPDPDVPYEETMGAVKGLLDEGLIAMAGISNADPDQIRLAHSILGDGLVSVQNQFSPKFLGSRPELDLCAELGLAFLAWSPLGGMSDAGDLGESFTAFAEVADKHDVSPQRVCLAWELSLSEAMVPIPGASRPESFTDSFAAMDLTLDQEDLARLSS